MLPRFGASDMGGSRKVWSGWVFSAGATSSSTLLGSESIQRLKIV